MLKVIATVAAIISSFVAITLYTATIPDVQKQAADNAAAITSNETYIKTVDDSVENLQDAFDGIDTRVETLEGKKIYVIRIDKDNVYISSTVSANIYISFTVYTDKTFNSSMTIDAMMLRLTEGDYYLASGQAFISNTTKDIYGIMLKSYMSGSNKVYYLELFSTDGNNIQITYGHNQSGINIYEY